MISMADRRHTTGWTEFVPDSPLEGNGFELSVPREIGSDFEASSGLGPIPFYRIL
jgi:hypothetical protein